MCDSYGMFVLLSPRFLEVDRNVLVKHSKLLRESHPHAINQKVVFDSKIVSFGALQMLVEYFKTGKLEPKLPDLELLLIAADSLQTDWAMAHLFKYLHEVVASQISDMRKLTKELLLTYLRMYPLVYRYEKKYKFQHKIIKMPIPKEDASLPQAYLNIPVCITFVLAHHFERIMNEPQILDLERDRIYEILSSDHLHISERDVLRTIKLWVNYKLKRRKKHFVGLTKCIRPDPNLPVCFPILF